MTAHTDCALTEKPTNPKDAVGIRKAPLSTLSMAVTAEVGFYLAGGWQGAIVAVPAEVLFEVGLGMLEGARKYGRFNYRAVGVRASVYYDAYCRHMAAWWRGEDIDHDSGLSHITKAICSLYVLRDAAIQNKLTDDRPPRCVAAWRDDFVNCALDPHSGDSMELYENSFGTMLVWWEGTDDLLGTNPVVVAIASLYLLRDAMLTDGWVDPRPAKRTAGWLVPLNVKAGQIIDAKPNAEEPFTIAWQPLVP